MSKNKKETKKTTTINLDKEDILQAVVVVDSFHKNFLPISSCSALLPLVNRKLLDYCLEWLNISGVREVLVLCSSHVDEIRHHLRDQFFLSIEVKVLFSEKCYSFGDVMRALDGYAVIRSTFVLLSVDVIGNFNFLPIIEKFKTLQKVDKQFCMMLLLKEVGNRRNDLHNDTIIAYNANNRLIHYQVQNSKQVKLPMEVILEQEFIDIRSDLLNPGVAICTAEIPLLFSENFDCQSLNDLISGLLMNEEISLKTVYCEVLSDGQYMAKANNWPMYQIISRDVIQRWTYPLVPDVSERYSYRKNSIYLKNVTFSKDCKLGCNVVIGNNTKLNKNVSINNSIIGSDCQIGERVLIENSFIYDGVRIDSGTTVRCSVIGEKCHVNKNCTIDKNSLLGPGLVLKEKTKLETISLVSDKFPGTEQFSKYSDSCFEYKTNVDNSDSEEEEVLPLQTRSLVNTEIRLFDDDEESSESDSDCSVPVDDVKTFYGEVVDSLKRGYRDRLNCENLILEINSSRYAYNITVNEVNYNLLMAILNIDLYEIEHDVRTVLQHTISKFKYFLPLMQNYIKNDNAQIDCLSAIGDVLRSAPLSMQIIASKILQFLYDKDILSEEHILNWYEKLPENGLEVLTSRLAPFIEWLKEAEEESEEAEEESEELKEGLADSD